MDRKKIAFYIQTHKPIGGSQVLFLNLATYISKNFKEFQCYYINYRNKIIEDIYGDSDIIFKDAADNDYNELEDAVFFAPFNYVFYLINKIKKLKRAKMCLYFYHPEIMDWLNMQIIERKVKFETLMRTVSLHNGYCFMDSSNFFAIERLYKFNFDHVYVPVTVSDNLDSALPICEISKDRLRIGWLGRLDRDKIYSVKNILDNLQAMDFDIPIDFYIIGDGNAKNLIQYNTYTPQIRFIFTSYLYGEERNCFIRENIDIMIAMGISAIDASMLGVPTVLPLVSPVSFNDNKFLYIYDTKDYSLGWNVNDLKKAGCKYKTLEHIINEIYCDSNKKSIVGKRCKDYVITNFSVAKGTEKLLAAVSRSTLTVPKILKNSLVRKQLCRYKLYNIVRRRNTFESFHEFCARLKRINMEATLTGKVKRLKKEIAKTLKRTI